MFFEVFSASASGHEPLILLNGSAGFHYLGRPRPLLGY